ncbi:4Fe-4S single cluster domain-containing protein [Candidatus Latescibacterota bacterium]
MDFSYPLDIDCLNIAELCPYTKALGPGRRFAIWLQGCPRSCDGCISPEWREFKKEQYFTPGELAQQINKSRGIEGITISGGEPMIQAVFLVEMLDLAHSHFPDLSVICFTGYILEELVESDSKSINDLLKHIDVLIDGPFIKSLDDGVGLRGSSNQRIRFLTERYADLQTWFETCERVSEDHLRKGYNLHVGLKK